MYNSIKNIVLCQILISYCIFVFKVTQKSLKEEIGKSSAKTKDVLRKVSKKSKVHGEETVAGRRIRRVMVNNNNNNTFTWIEVQKILHDLLFP